jgi:hypothetical protein
MNIRIFSLRQWAVFFGLMFLIVLTVSAGTRTISCDVEISQSAINRFISAQTFPRLNGSYFDPKFGELEYDISITKPIVSLDINSATVSFTITAVADGATYVLPVNTSITIPSGALTLSQVYAVLVNFPNVINTNFYYVPAWVRNLIISGYSNMQLATYPSKLIDYANSAVPQFLDIQVTDIGLSWAALIGKLKFTISAVVNANPPTFNGQWMKRGPWLLSLRFGSNVASTVKRVLVHTGLPQEIYRNETLELPISKNGSSVQIDLSGISVTTYYITVLYGSNYGQYLRRYAFTFNTATYYTWFPMTLTASID